MTNSTQPKDFDLEALRSGDREEYARLVEAHYEMIYRLAIKMLNDPHDAEDILQETFLKAYRHLQGFDGRSSLSTWLYRIATNEALMFLRRKKPHQVSLDESTETLEGEMEPVQIIDWCCMPEEELMSVEALSQLDQAVIDLPTSLRVVFILRDIQGLSTREVSDVLDLSESAVKTRLSRARMRLREELTSYYGKKLPKGGGR